MADIHEEPKVCVASKDLEQDKDLAALRTELQSVKHKLELQAKNLEADFGQKLTDSKKLDLKIVGIMVSLGIFFYSISTTAVGFYSNAVIAGAINPIQQESFLIKNNEATLRRDVDKMDAALEKFVEKTNEDIGSIKGEIGDTLDIEQLEGRFDAQVIQVTELGGRFSRIIEDRIQPRLDKLEEEILRLTESAEGMTRAELSRIKSELEATRNDLEQARIDLAKEQAGE